MSYSLLLATPSTFVHLSRSLSLFPFSLRHRSPIVLLPLACYHHALATPLALSRRGGVRSKFNFHQPTPLTYLPSASPSPCFSTTSSASSFFSTSPITPPGPPYHSGDPQHPGKEATGCIPRDKLRGSIIHGNLQAPLFKRRPSSISPGRRRRYRRHRDISPGGT